MVAVSMVVQLLMRLVYDVLAQIVVYDVVALIS